jgi:hypothetical protein
LAVLQRATALASQEGYVRLFVDEGEAMLRLLRLFVARSGTTDYSARLLSAFARKGKTLDVLNEREQEILRLMATGMSNSEIGESLWADPRRITPRVALFLSRLVGGDHDTRAGRLRIYKLESLQIAPILKETLTSSYDNRMDHECQLIQEIVLQQGLNECGAAGDTNVLSGLLLEPGDLFREVSFNQRRVFPLNFVQGG